MTPEPDSNCLDSRSLECTVPIDRFRQVKSGNEDIASGNTWGIAIDADGTKHGAIAQTAALVEDLAGELAGGAEEEEGAAH